MSRSPSLTWPEAPGHLTDADLYEPCPRCGGHTEGYVGCDLCDGAGFVDILARYQPGSHDQPWTWEDEARDLHSLPCPTEYARAQGIEVEPCDDPEPGCYQRKLEAHLRDLGRIDQPVCLGTDGRVWDGHHRIVAAIRLGLTEAPTEDEEPSR